MYDLSGKQQDITRLEERDLLIQAQRGSVYARNRLIEAYHPLLMGMCCRLSPRDMDPRDFYGDAVIGLVEAIEKKDVEHPVRLGPYARFYVKGAIIKSDFYKRTVGVNWKKRGTIRRLENLSIKLFTETGHVMLKTLAEMTGLTEEEVRRYQSESQFCKDLMSLDASLEDGGTYHDLIGDESSTDGYKEIDVQIDLEYFLSKLTRQERYIVTRFYGIPHKLTHKEIANKLGLSHVHVQRTCSEAMRKMQRLADALQDPKQVQRAIHYPQVVMHGL